MTFYYNCVLQKTMIENEYSVLQHIEYFKKFITKSEKKKTALPVLNILANDEEVRLYEALDDLTVSLLT